MNIFFYDWNSYNSNLVISALERLGHNVTVYKKKPVSYEIDAEFMQHVVFTIHEKKIDCLFTLNYIPLLASIGESCKIPYISWTQDSPQYPLYSPTCNFSCNYQFIFDKEEYKRLENLGSTRIHHATLCSDPEAFSNTIKEKGSIESEVCFLGKLYTDSDFERASFNESDSYLNGYFDALMNAQKGLYGCNVIEPSMPSEYAKRLLELSNDPIPDGYYIPEAYAASYILEKKVSSLERLDYLSAIGEKFNLAIYTGSTPVKEINADYRGFADYEKEMPRIFNGAKINLHFSPRNIRSGVSLRVFDVLASNGFLLTTYQPEIAELFRDGRELVMFSEKEELLDKIDYYLKNDAERARIAGNGYKKILRGYTYEHILQGLFKSVFG